MDDRAEVHGSQGVAYADLLHGNAIETYSHGGYDYAVEKAGSTKGWSFTIYEAAWNYGFHQEMAHFVDCVQHDNTPLVTGEDGRAVLEAVLAAYESARTGRKVELPFATKALRPIDLWKPPRLQSDASRATSSSEPLAHLGYVAEAGKASDQCVTPNRFFRALGAPRLRAGATTSFIAKHHGTRYIDRVDPICPFSRENNSWQRFKMPGKQRSIDGLS
jgi:hypothetical protein